MFAYTRDTDVEHLLVICNFTADEVPFELPEAYYGAETLISNYEGDCPVLRPYEAMMLYYKGPRR